MSNCCRCLFCFSLIRFNKRLRKLCRLAVKVLLTIDIIQTNDRKFLVEFQRCFHTHTQLIFISQLFETNVIIKIRKSNYGTYGFVEDFL